MFAPRITRDRNSRRGAVGQNFHPGPRVLMCNNRRHGPGEHGMPGRKRCTRGVILEKAAVASPLVRTFPARDQLQAHVDWVGVNERFGGQKTSFPRVRIISDQPSNEDRAGSDSAPIQTNIRNVAADIHVVMRNDADGVSVRRDDCRGPQNEDRVPFQICPLKWSDVDAALIARETPRDTANAPRMG